MCRQFVLCPTPHTPHTTFSATCMYFSHVSHLVCCQRWIREVFFNVLSASTMFAGGVFPMSICFINKDWIWVRWVVCNTNACATNVFACCIFSLCSMGYASSPDLDCDVVAIYKSAKGDGAWTPELNSFSRSGCGSLHEQLFLPSESKSVVTYVRTDGRTFRHVHSNVFLDVEIPWLVLSGEDKTTQYMQDRKKGTTPSLELHMELVFV